MNKLVKVFEKMANAIQGNKTIQSISGGLMTMLPALMIGALGSMIQQIPFAGYQAFLQSTGISALCVTLVNCTQNLLALYASFAIAWSYTKNEGKDGVSAGFISMISFLVVTPMTVVGEGWFAVTSLPIDWCGPKGMFTAMIVSIIAAKIYCLCVEKKVTIKLPEQVPSFIQKSFAAIVPAAIIGLLFAVVSFGFSKTAFGSVHQAIYTFIGAPLTNIGGSAWACMLIYVLTGICWFLGIHGIAVVSVVMPIWMAGDAANMAAAVAGAVPPNIVTYSWTNVYANIGGAGCTLGFVLLCCFRAKSKQLKSLGRLAVVPSLFSINEPVVFGAPMMMNFVTMIPFILTPVLLVFLTYILTLVGFVPIGNGLSAPLPLPVLNGFFNGGIRGAIWNLCEVVLVTVIYYPFFKKLDNDAYALEQGEGKAE